MPTLKICCRRFLRQTSQALFFLSWALAGSCVLASAQAASGKSALPCKPSQLSAVNDRKDSESVAGGLGHHAITIAITNRSLSSCVLQGVPSVALSYYPSGRSFALKTCANCLDYLFSKQDENAIILKPLESAYVVLGFDINDGNWTCTEADPKFGPRFQDASMALGLKLADQKKPLRIIFKEWRSCGPIDVTPFLRQPPMNGSLPHRE
ncbi:MAG: hypothetical protein ABSF17_19000 [Terracidiphilus sp.]|jgi:hypothetical protein